MSWLNHFFMWLFIIGLVALAVGAIYFAQWTPDHEHTSVELILDASQRLR